MKEVISTNNAPAAIGPYSQAVNIPNGLLAGTLYISGQIPVNPATGEMPEGITEQTRQSLANLGAILEEAGMKPKHVVKTTVFLSDMNNFAAMNEVYAQFFAGTDFPARAAVEVARLPKDALVEIEAIAIKG